MLHVRFYIDKRIEVDSLSSFCDKSKHLSPALEIHFFLDADDLVFVSNASSFEFSCDLINSVQDELKSLSVNSEVLTLLLN